MSHGNGNRYFQSADRESQISLCSSACPSIRAGSRICESCLSEQSRPNATAALETTEVDGSSGASGQETRLSTSTAAIERRRRIGRDYSEPDLRRSAELIADAANNLRINGRSLENIIENEENGEFFYILHFRIFFFFFFFSATMHKFRRRIFVWK